MGVEGVGDDIIKSAIEKCGVSENDKHKRLVTKADLFADGLSGGENSFKYRKKCSQRNLICLTEFRQICFLDVINSLYDYDEYKSQIKLIKGGE
ncbi:MAG: DUF4093 domain-containing protein [Clostridiales bacterium]|nr:MAG: DUF4093 domain-containing protein [Clostridiales bacterium]